MKNLTASDISRDLSALMEGFSSGGRLIPSPSRSFKLSAAVPFIATLLSVIGATLVYLTGYHSQAGLDGILNYFESDGWVFVLPTIVVGAFFTLLTYNKFILYFSIPKDVRENSVVLNHLKKTATKTVVFFITLMIFSTVLSAYSTWFAFSITGLLFALLMIGNLLIGLEINRLGAGVALEKIFIFLKKI
ncbi:MULTISPECIES: hypothetical protein [Pantoea]|uniref:Uncharacterized protein n=1 Tax=Pantoea ananas TaxID=553 RepID=A0AAJ1FRH2_PANAN|nr:MULTISPECIES: hypothetical protein [Pantoea]MCH9300010.1 hypothetical protein [Pantoea allii]MCW0345822.1 hypothetical protein [Pantoea ananatis]OAD97960.1 hypothetical protein A6A26_23650 [Pantoea sp. OXWO6B1]WRH23458.1 hypothetical protein GC090_22785 [Pantoea sp. JZ29]